MDPKQIQPTGNRLLVKMSDSETTTESGLVIPESAQEDAMEGIVISCGPGRVNDDGIVISMGYEPGNRVLLSKTRYGGVELRFGDDTYRIIAENDVVAVISDKETV